MHLLEHDLHRLPRSSDSRFGEVVNGLNIVSYRIVTNQCITYRTSSGPLGMRHNTLSMRPLLAGLLVIA